MSDTKTLIVNKLDILSAVNSANLNMKHSTQNDVLLLNNTWRRVLQTEQNSNTYLHRVGVSPDDFRVLERFGVSEAGQEPYLKQVNVNNKNVFRNFIIHLFSFLKF